MVDNIVNKKHPSYNLWDRQQANESPGSNGRLSPSSGQKMSKKQQELASAAEAKAALIDAYEERIKGNQKMTVSEVLASAGVNNHRVNAKVASNENLTDFLSMESR